MGISKRSWIIWICQLHALQTPARAPHLDAPLFRSALRAPLDNVNLTKTTIDEVQDNVRKHLSALVEDKAQVELALVRLNEAAQLAVDVSKSHPLGATTPEERQALILTELYAALKTRCSSGTKLLIQDFDRRRAQNELAALSDLVVHSPQCRVNMTQPLKRINLPDDILVDAADSEPQTGNLKESSLAVFQEGALVASWPVAAMELPVEPVLALAPCFSFGYLGSPVMLCASTPQARDEWIVNLTFNALCLKEKIGRDFAPPQSLLLASAVVAQKPKTQVQSAAPPPADGAAATPPAESSSTSTSTALPGLLHVFVGVTPDNHVVMAHDRLDLEQALLPWIQELQ